MHKRVLTTGKVPSCTKASARGEVQIHLRESWTLSDEAGDWALCPCRETCRDIRAIRRKGDASQRVNEEAGTERNVLSGIIVLPPNHCITEKLDENLPESREYLPWRHRVERGTPVKAGNSASSSDIRARTNQSEVQIVAGTIVRADRNRYLNDREIRNGVGVGARHQCDEQNRNCPFKAFHRNTPAHRKVPLSPLGPWMLLSAVYLVNPGIYPGIYRTSAAWIRK